MKRKPMTLARFFKLLPRRGWEISAEGVIRKRFYPICPIGAVANKLAKRRTFADNYKDAADAIGLPRPLANRIADAADFKDPTPLRRRLLQHCGLEEAERDW